MSVITRCFEKEDVEAWDKLIDQSWNGTFLHTRRFLSYHGNRFRDVSLVLEDGRGRMAGVFPAALDPSREDLVVSHPGLTYGGVVHAGALRGQTMIEALHAVSKSYKTLGLRRMRYKVVPYIYHAVPSSDDVYALFRLGAARFRCDLSTTVDLSYRPPPNKLRRRDLRKAQRSGVRVAQGSQFLGPFWAILEENLAAKHQTSPTHSLEEMARLQEMFPAEIRCMVGVVENEIAAGVVLFCTRKVVHVQYAASTAFGNSVAALSVVMEKAIETGGRSGVRFFDFGVSTEDEGTALNEGLYRFKASFGAGGVTQEFYEVELG